MWKLKGAALAAFVLVGCGHATPTGSAQNDWTTPTGHGSATNPRVINPMLGGMQPTHNRSVFARREAPTLQPQPSDTSSVDTAPPADNTLPPADPRATDVPAPMTTEPAPDTAAPEHAPDAAPRSMDEVPPYVTPTRP